MPGEQQSTIAAMKRWVWIGLLALGCGAGAKNSSGVVMPDGSGDDGAVGVEEVEADGSSPEMEDSAKAHEHLPANCEVVVRLRLNQLARVPAIRDNLVPAFVAEVEEDGMQGQLAAYLEDLDLDPGRDLRGAVVCISKIHAGEPDYLFALGGDIQPGSFVPATEKHSSPGEFRRSRVGGMTVLEDTEDGRFNVQAEDGTILVTNRLSLLSEAYASSNAFEDYEIPFDEQLAVVATQQGVRRMISMTGDDSLMLQLLQSVDRVEMFASLDTGRVGMGFDFPSADQAKAVLEAVEMLTAQRDVLIAETPALAPILDSLQTGVEGRRFTASVVVPEELIAMAVQEMAADMGD